MNKLTIKLDGSFSDEDFVSGTVNDGQQQKETLIVNDQNQVKHNDVDFFISEDKFFGQHIQFIENIDDIEEQANSVLPRLFISGFPFDEGAFHNGGRLGSEKAPQDIRDLLEKERIYTDEEFSKRLKVFDVGNLSKVKLEMEEEEEEGGDEQVQQHHHHHHHHHHNHQGDKIYDRKGRGREISIEEAHLMQRSRVGSVLDSMQKGTSIHQKLLIIGGTNDQSYCNALGLMDVYPDMKIGVISIDSRLDVYPTNKLNSNTRIVHNGSPFYQLLENNGFKKSNSKFVSFAAQGSQASKEDAEYLQSKGIQINWLEKNIRRTIQVDPNHAGMCFTQAGQVFWRQLKELEETCDQILISFDLQAINAMFCPGVSFPSVIGGLTDEEAIEILKVAAVSPKVKIVDISEYNPAVENKRSGKLVARLIFELAVEFSKIE